MRVVDDRRAEHGAVDAAIGDREDSAFEVFKLDLAISGGFGESEDVLFDSGKVFLIAVAYDGYHEALVCADGDADVVVVLLDDFIAFNAGIDFGHGLQCVGYGFGEEGHEAELDAVAFDEGFLVRFAELHDGAHVDFVEGREHGGLLGRVDQVVGDLASQGCYFSAGFALGGACRC